VNRPTIPEPSWQAWHDNEPIRLGVSSCLLGAEVRYDGGHKRDRYLTEVLGEWFDWVPVCPELEIGLGVPRPTIQLESGDPEPQLIEPISGEVLTERMESYARDNVDQLRNAGLDGFIFKGASPSCGVERVKVFGQDERPARDGIGVFARVLIRRWPGLPVAEGGWLEDPNRRGGFFELVLEHHCQRTLSRRDLDPRHLAELHAAHQALLAELRNPVRTS
jgi:uncharacterized protein YbbK (DUF523 family)